ncbi:MAG TPA: argininosuccinate lyase [Terriglobales bacterium]|nr:argininosuccinate lyase [Terriglobales bacterium]
MSQTTKPKSETKPVNERFPAPVYAETVLMVNFEDAKKYFLESLLEIHYAHTLMLTHQGILPAADAKKCLEALDALDRRAITAAVYDGRCEDLFFYIEEQLAKQIDAETAGKMHTARSRNDIDLTLYRMGLRREVLKIVEAVCNLRGQLLVLAEANLETVMPAYTHTQPAQPTTLAHYLMAAVEIFERDAQRLRAAFATVNRNPLGACAITTTGFPIDRESTARLLGFEGLQINSYGAIAAIDYLAEAASAAAVAMVNLGKLVQDLLQWCTKEFGFLRLRDPFVQFSSIMPQKRNPVSLEHTRILASKALGQAQAILTCAHNTPFGDIVDSEDDLQPLAFSMFADAERALRLFAGLMGQCDVRVERLRQAANDSFLTVTELADTLVRQEGLSFRAAHRLVSEAVKAVGPTYQAQRLVDEVERLAPETIGHSLRTPPGELLRALDAENFVRVRRVVGGPAPETVKTEISRAHQELAEIEAWLKGKWELLERYPQRIRKESAAILEGSSSNKSS